MTSITDGTSPSSIADAGTWIDALPEPTRDALTALGELLVGATSRPAASETAERFTMRSLGVTGLSGIVDEARELSAVQRLTVALAVAELIDEHNPSIGPDDYTNPPAYTQTSLGGTTYRHPQCLRAAFPAGTLLSEAPIVIGIDARSGSFTDPEVTAYILRDYQVDAQRVLDALMDRAYALNPYRGRAVRATLSAGHGLTFTSITLPSTATRDTVIVDTAVWDEIDLGIAAVRDHHAMLNRHGLGSRRGVLLSGPPGTGKSAISAAVAAELLGDFTVIYVEAKAGEHLLTAVVEESQRIGGPVLIVLEDVDLVVRDRRAGNSGGLAELLQAMDIQPDARILTLASTNDLTTLDAAAIRAGRFDSIVTVDYPDAAAGAEILTKLTEGIPGDVDAVLVARRVPTQTSGSDLREIVRRAVLAGGGEISTSGLLAEVSSGRYRALPEGTGQYL
ncbi:AAA family ATPase [Gordonia sihwensis]|uniref:AAA family ATPase n=1 Tax=Gordonia sihwensis TaxID=173559 RepID=UPI003D969E83